MPTLLALLPCEKLLYDRSGSELSNTEEVISLISIMDTVYAYMATGSNLTPTTGIPLNWVLFVLWLQDVDDIDKIYEQRVGIRLPNGQIMGYGGIQTFSMSAHKVRNILPIHGFPIMTPRIRTAV